MFFVITNIETAIMTREEILSTVNHFEVETKVKAWTFQIDKKFYQVVEFGGVYRVPPGTSIWETNKKGKRLSNEAIFTINGNKYLECINQFIDSMGITE